MYRMLMLSLLHEALRVDAHSMVSSLLPVPPRELASMTLLHRTLLVLQCVSDPSGWMATPSTRKRYPRSINGPTGSRPASGSSGLASVRYLPRLSGCLTSLLVFPLFWALGGITLFFGVHRSSASSIEDGTAKVSKFINQAQIDEKHRLEDEKRWAKRCAWAFAFVCCLIPVIITTAIIAPYIDAPAAVQTAVAAE